MIKLDINLNKPHKEGIFLERVNRFVAKVQVDGGIYYAHLHDSGRLKELLIPDTPIMLIPQKSPKTDFKVIAIYREGYGWILLNSGFHRNIMESILKERLIPQFKNIVDFKAEYKIDNHRIDFLLVYPTYTALMELKGCTLFEETTCLFPDAPTKRGAQHLRILAKHTPSYITFIVCHPSIEYVKPNCQEDKVFCQDLKEAINKGVIPLALKIQYYKGDIFFHGTIPVLVP